MVHPVVLELESFGFSVGGSMHNPKSHVQFSDYKIFAWSFAENGACLDPRFPAF